MRSAIIILAGFAVSACSASTSTPPPTVTAVDTFCTRVDRYHATDAQKSAFKRDRATWEPLVNYLGGINEQWDSHCK